MKGFPQHNISSETALDILKNSDVLRNVYVSGKIELPSGEHWANGINIHNCVIEHFECVMVSFEKPISITNTEFKNCTFTFSYFLQGFKIEDSLFKNSLDFQAGFHNKPTFPFVLKGNAFNNFVNFFDCQFESDVEIIKNDFKAGTNILSQTLMIQFDVPPLIEGNIGQLACETEQ